MSKDLTAHLDWTSYTGQYNGNETELDNLKNTIPRGELFAFTGEEIEKGRFFNRGMKMLAGKVFWNDRKPGQGISVQLSGDDLGEMRKAGMLEEDLLAFIKSVDGRMTTLHACMNLHNWGASMADVIYAEKSGNFKSRARRVGVYTSKAKVGGTWKQGDTLYVGSAKSPLQLRIYDKAAEHGIDGDWIRIEMVWRNRQAQGAHRAMVATGILPVLRGAVRHQIVFDIPWWAEAMTGAATTPYVLPRKQSNRYLWLMRAVLPALTSELSEEQNAGGDALYLAFYEALSKARPYSPLDK